SSDLSTTAKSALNDAIAIMQANPSLQLSINGYTDNVGSAVSNQRLSERRAKSAYDYVISQGIDAERLSYRGLGENDPIANNNTAAGRYQNRRVELILTDNSGNSLAPTSGTNLNVVSYGSTTKSCSGHPIFNLPTSQKPRVLSRLGTNPEFGDSHGLTSTEFYEKLSRAHQANARDRQFLDNIFRAMGYTNGFNDANADLFNAVVLPYGTEGNIGYSINHKTLFAKLNVNSERDLQAFRIRSANGCDLHFMKTCGNHMFF
ncbi:MAG: OmpA family protein, partial [Saprospiraceae bacterium]